MNNLFDVVGDNFFVPLASPNKQIYLDCLAVIYSEYKYKTYFGAEKESVVERLTNYFDYEYYEIVKTDDIYEDFNNSREKALLFIRLLKKYGWIDLDDDDNGIVHVSMPSYAAKIFEMLINVSEQKDVEFQGEIAALYSLVCNDELFQENHNSYIEFLKPALEYTKQLKDSLKQLNSDIFKASKSVTPSQSLEDVLETFNKFSENITQGPFCRMFTDNNIKKYRGCIIERFEKIKKDKPLLDRMNKSCLEIEKCNNEYKAQDIVNEMIKSVIDWFGQYDDISTDISKNHSIYSTKVKKRTNYLMSNKSDIQGKINSILDYMARDAKENSLDGFVDEDMQHMFNVNTMGTVSSLSIRPPSKRKNLTSSDELMIEEVSEEEIEAMKNAERERLEKCLTNGKVRDIVKEKLLKKNIVSAEEFGINSLQDVIKIILIEQFAYERDSEYEIIPGTEKITINGFTFNDFKVKKKGKKI